MPVTAQAERRSLRPAGAPVVHPVESDKRDKKAETRRIYRYN